MSLFEIIVRAVWLRIEGYFAHHVGQVTEGRQVVSYSDDGKRTKITSAYSNPGVNMEYDGFYVKMPFDSGTKDTDKDRRHHTTPDIGSVLSGKLYDGVQIFHVVRNEKGQFEDAGEILEWNSLCPQVPDSMVSEYLADRIKFHTLSKEFDSVKAAMKKRGLLPTVSRGPYVPDMSKTHKVFEIRTAWELSGLPKTGFKWAELSDEVLSGRYESIPGEIAPLAEFWNKSLGLDLDPKQLFRALDAGLVESGRATATTTEKKITTGKTAKEFAAMVAAGKVIVGTVETEGQLVSA